MLDMIGQVCVKALALLESCRITKTCKTNVSVISNR